MQYAAAAAAAVVNCLPWLCSGRVNLSDEQPVVDVAKGVRHVGGSFIMHPFTINDELVLVVPVGGCTSMLAGRF